MDLWIYPALVLGGILCGIINALAGGGSFVTLPLLLLFGLPPQVANATNRVAIVLQCAAGTATYHRHKVLPWRHVPGLAVAMVMGAIPGALLAAYADESLFRKVAAVLFAVMIVTVFIDPKRWARQKAVARIRLRLYPVFFLLGVYGGFLQAGIGTLLISMFVLVGGYDVVRGNALKFALAMIFSIAALLTFASTGYVEWIPGLILAVGTVTGGFIGARVVIAKGAGWIRYIVALSAAGAIVKLLVR
jgi:uncharacterized membrane protein YfcA